MAAAESPLAALRPDEEMKMTASELEFLAEDELVDVVPRFAFPEVLINPSAICRCASRQQWISGPEATHPGERKHTCAQAQPDFAVPRFAVSCILLLLPPSAGLVSIH
jgi:hypothetical protein